MIKPFSIRYSGTVNTVAIIQLLAVFMGITAVFTGCNDIRQNAQHPEISTRNIVKGKELAAMYCQRCHLLPDPLLLDTKSWEKGVLPHMGPFLGIFEFHFQRYPFITDRNLPRDFYPSKPLVDLQQWQQIMDYYMGASPDSLGAQQRDKPLSAELHQFKAALPALRYDNPAVSFVKIGSGNYSGSLFIADMFKQTMYRFTPQLQIKDSLFSTGAICDAVFEADKILTCNIGIFDPTDEAYGYARYMRFNVAGGPRKDSLPLFNKLRRPVELASADLNQDGKTDYIVCEFGYLAGGLSWEENKGNNHFEHHAIRQVPGATRAWVRDANGDGLPDIWVLFAQGEEGIFLFTNRGNGQFEVKEVMRFPPMYGSSYFELADMNKDGAEDIIYTAGDNADYSTVLKPYHGLYIFLNDGSNHFGQAYFYPVNGCYKAMASDFDQDGDLDIATIAFFADYAHQPEEGFIYFENTGNLAFKPRTLPAGTAGRWITMDAGDLDGDGWTDLVLGNFSTAPAFIHSRVEWKHGPPFMVLINTSKK